MNKLSDEEFINELIKRSEEFADQECRKCAVEELEALKEELIKYRCVASNSQIIVRIDDRIKKLKGE